ncbi:MAG: hypothetical protein WCN92_09285, partial [Eubacteriales bacterium]
MSKLRTLAIIMVVVLIAVLTAACSKNTGTTQPTTVKQSSSISKDVIFDFYNKVQIDQTKEQVVAELGVAGKESTQLKNSFSYTNADTGYGVSVIFSDANKATSKTLIYSDRKELAGLFNKTVTQAQSDTIKKGMTYDQIKSILGEDGVEISTTQIPFDNNKLSSIRI